MGGGGVKSSAEQSLKLPVGWLVSALGDIATFEMGQAPAGAASNFNGVGTVFVKAGEFGLAEPIVREWTTEPKKYAKNGDVLICVVGATAGKLNFGIDCAIGRSVAAIRPEIGVKQKTIYFQLLPNVERMRANVSGSAQGVISQADLSRLVLRVPPAAEQTRIVEKLEELLSDLDAGVAELKVAQKKLAQYRQSLLKAAVEGALTADWRAAHRAVNTETETGAQLLARILTERRSRWETRQLAKFQAQGKTATKGWQAKYPEPVAPDSAGLPELPLGWVWASVEQVASDERYSLAIGPFGSNLKVPDYREEGVPLVFVRNIRSGNYGGVHTKYVTPDKAYELRAHSIAAGDVLITKMGEPPGDADVYPDSEPPAVITADCIKVRCWSGLMLPHFLKSVINSYIGQRQIEPMTQGVAQKKVSLGRFSNLAVPVPSSAEQVEIMKMVAAANIDALILEIAIAHGLKQSAAQRKNILQAAFSGQLVPQDPADEPASALLARIRAERAGQPKLRKSRQIREVL